MRLMMHIRIKGTVECSVVAPAEKFDVVVCVEDAVIFTLNNDCLLHPPVENLKGSWIRGNGKSCLRKVLVWNPVKTIHSDGNFEIQLTEADPFIAVLTHGLKCDI